MIIGGHFYFGIIFLILHSNQKKMSRTYHPEDYQEVFTTLDPYLGFNRHIDVEGFLKENDLLTSMARNALEDYYPVLAQPPGAHCIMWFLEVTPEILEEFGVKEATDISDMTLESIWRDLDEETKIKLIGFRARFKTLSFIKPLDEKQYL
jgi:hypothetical protein